MVKLELYYRVWKSKNIEQLEILRKRLNRTFVIILLAWYPFESHPTILDSFSPETQRVWSIDMQSRDVQGHLMK